MLCSHSGCTALPGISPIGQRRCGQFRPTPGDDIVKITLIRYAFQSLFCHG